ncbi:hypothetical protein GCM10027062_24560 [Nocardioides hungaricus]
MALRRPEEIRGDARGGVRYSGVWISIGLNGVVQGGFGGERRNRRQVTDLDRIEVRRYMGTAARIGDI